MPSSDEIASQGNAVIQEQLASNQPAISIRELSKTYPVAFARLKAFFKRKSKPPVEALRNVSITVNRGEIFGLIGRNGAGKTTLTKIIATLVQPTSGEVKVNGYDSVDDDEQVRNQIGLATAEERSFYWRLTAEQNLLFFARLYGLSDRTAKRRMEELFTKFDLGALSRRRFGEMSTGNKQRLAVARALLPEPPVLLLDEPTRSLDPLAAAQMRTTIAELARQDPPVTILFTSHNLSEVETLCNRVAIISRGEIKAVDSPANLRAISSGAQQFTVHISATHPAGVKAALLAAGEELREESRELLSVTLSQRGDDDHLDRILRLVHQHDARVVNVESIKPTLLDVLESYETEEAT